MRVFADGEGAAGIAAAQAGETVRWRTYTYDAVGRTLTEYGGNTTRITDAAGKWKKYTYDAFGNLTKVTEPDPTHGNVDTLYTYDQLNRLTNVNMTRGAVTQTRTFAYYGQTSKLWQTTNPENGTVQYTYDSEQRLQRKTDAKGQKVEYTYDSYDRVVEINRYPAPGTAVDPCQRTKLYYDYNGVVQYFAENTWGRR